MRVLVIKLSSLGDLFHALPAVHCLKYGLNARIDWVTQEEYVPLVQCFADVDQVIPFPRKRFFRNLHHFSRLIRRTRYDYVIDLQGLMKSAIVTAMTRAEKRIGPSFHRECSGLFYDAVCGSRNCNRHAVDQAMDVVRYLGLDELSPRFNVNFPAVPMKGVGMKVGFVPFSRWKTKNWPAEHYVSLAEKILKDFEATLYLLGGKDEAEGCNAIARAIGSSAVSLAGNHDIPQTGGVIAQMDMLIANDTGPAHMAVATGTSVAVLYGPTDPARTGPYGDSGMVFSEGGSCGPCLKNTCRLGSMSCMRLITPARVYEGIYPILKSAAVR